MVDLLQVWSLNRFSGMVSVTSAGRTGHIYFVEGEIVHAEAEGAGGEPALRAIIGWPDGAFEPFPNTATLKRTIQKRVNHLLLDAHREMDERRRLGDPAAPAPKPPPREASRPSVLEQVRAIPGVTRVVRFGVDGRPVGSEGAESEALAAKGLYLALNHAAAVAEAFGLHDLALASVEGPRESFVVVHSNRNYLCLAVEANAAVEPVVARMRAVLSPAGAR